MKAVDSFPPTRAWAELDLNSLVAAGELLLGCWLLSGLFPAASWFAAVGTFGYLLSAPLLGAIAAGLALVAALLNAATGFCLGCEMYLLIRRVASPRAIPADAAA